MSAKQPTEAPTGSKPSASPAPPDPRACGFRYDRTPEQALRLMQASPVMLETLRLIRTEAAQLNAVSADTIVIVRALLAELEDIP